jgi:hypothetical protein
MDVLDWMNKATKIGKYLVPVLFVINMVSMASAQTASTNIQIALISLCNISQTFLGAAAMVLIVLAGLTYAIGQIMGAETRARATVWATAMLTGAIIGIIIYLVAPIIINALLANTGVTPLGGGGANPCSPTGPLNGPG